MTKLVEFSGYPLVHALGWTLLHFLWQGALVALVLWLVLGFLGGRSSQARYGAACFALVFMVAMPPITFARIASMELEARSEVQVSAVAFDPGMLLQVGIDAPVVPWPMRMAVTLDRWVPWLLVAWFAGAVFFAARLNFGLLVARRLKSAKTEAPPDELLRVFDALKVRVGIRCAVSLLHSARVQVPTVIGWLRPVVLIPASCLTGLSMEQIEAIFCHELAHIRRHDYLVSVFQSVAEALLFYHPAVWWVSQQVRRERECCCDEVAVGMGGDVLAYAKALSYLEERRAAFPEFVLGANGGVLTMRIKRLLGCKEDAEASQFAAFTLLALLVAAAGSYAVTAARAQEGSAIVKATPSFAVGGGAQEAAGGSATSEPTRQELVQDTAPHGPVAHPAPLVVRGDGAIEGIVVDPTGALVPRANVRAINTDLRFSMGKVTDNSGMCSLSPLPPGRYRVEVNVPGFQRLVQENVAIDGAQKIVLNLKLKVGGVAETLTVASAPLPAVAIAAPPPVEVPAAKPGKPLRVSSGTMAGNLISRVDPVYPADAKAEHVQGVVVLRATISKTGTIENVQAVSGPPPLMVSAIDAVRQWKYKPYLLNGEPTAVETTININYTLEGSAEPQGQSPMAEYEGIPLRKIGGGVSAPILLASVEPGLLPFARLMARAQSAAMAQATPSVPASTAVQAPAQPAPAPSPAPVQPKAAKERAYSDHGLTQEQCTQIDAEMAAAKQAIAETTKRLNSPEFRKRMEDAQRQTAETAKRLTAERLNSPEIRKQMEDAQKEAMKAGKELGKIEFKKQFADVKQQTRELERQDVNSVEFRKEMEEVRKKIEAAAEEIRAARDLANPPAQK